MMDVYTRPLASLVIDGRQVRLTPQTMTRVSDTVFTSVLQGVRVDLTVTQPNENSFTTLLRLTNESGANSPRITAVRSFDAAFPAATALFDGITGEAVCADSFVPYTRQLQVEPYVMEPSAGRSSSVTAFPFFDISTTAPDGGDTWVFGIGWTGQWHGELACDGSALTVAVGLADCDFYLLPGESVRFPRVLCMRGESPAAARLAFRRLMRDKFSPQADMDKELLLPMAIQPFDRYYAGNFGTTKNPAWATEAGQKAEIDALDKLPSLDSVWLDAAWFGGGAWPHGVGNFSFAPGFPNGLRPVTDYAHQKGLKFILWFEPERVIIGSEMEQQHPEFLVYPTDGGNTCLYNLADPAALAHMTQLLGDMIISQGVDWFRMDCNIEPLDYWRINDAPGRKGITELHYIENLYRMWDDLKARIPGLLIDDCASGGRRLDMEMLSRAVSLWRSDTGCFPERDHFQTSIWNSQQIISLGRYLPYSTVAHWEAVPYDVRSTGTQGVICNYDVLNPDFDFAAAETILEECARVRPLWNGDFYPLTGADTRDDNWAAYQLHREDLDKGMVYAFRKKNAAEERFAASLGAIDPNARYAVTLTDEQMQKTALTLSGSELASYTFHAPQKRSSILLEYERV